MIRACYRRNDDGWFTGDRHGWNDRRRESCDQAHGGYTREELIGSPCTILACNKCSARVTELGNFTHDLFETGFEERRKCVMHKKDGSSLPVMKNASLLVGTDKRIIGAVETLTDLSEIVSKDLQIAKLSAMLRKHDQFQGIIGRSAVMQSVFKLASDAALSDSPIIIYGETGTGKELLASAIHRLGNRKDGPFVKVNCAALSETLVESELFGHVKGAYTGAYKSRRGRFELAHRGDIFLDEIGDIPLSMQVKILRVPQEKEFERVGDSVPMRVDVRIISATHRDLVEMITKNQYREYLFYRLNVIPIRLPPLREKLEDIPLLVANLLEAKRLATEKNITGISRDAMNTLMNYRWPGNIRELVNALDYAFVVCRTSCIEVDHLPQTLFADKQATKTTLLTSSLGEEAQVLNALKATGGKRAAAAKWLGISRQALWKKMVKLGIRSDFAVQAKNSDG